MIKLRLSFILTTSLALCACNTYQSGDPRAPACNEMKSQLIFTGNTSNTRQAEIERSQAPLLQQNFDKKCT